MGPTKEELANYFKNNRKYFDELANLYKQTDPEYYMKYIASFYDTPLTSLSGKKSVRPAIAVFAAALTVLAMGIVLFFMVNQNNVESDFNGGEEKIEKEIESDNVKLLDSDTKVKELSDYEKGIMYYKLEEFDKSEKFLEKVSINSSDFSDARKKLTEIKRKKTDGK